MTYDEYNKIRKEKEDSRGVFKVGAIFMCSILLIATLWLSVGNCSDTVQSIVFGLNGWIWLLCVYIYDLKKEKDDFELKFLYTRVKDK